jgi:transcriptional regulator with XRE-family HTH domain
MLESGKHRPRLETLDTLADALGVEVGDFFPAQVISLEEWLEERCGHAYLALEVEELRHFLEGAGDLEEQTFRRGLLRREINAAWRERKKHPATEPQSIGGISFEEIHNRYIRTLLMCVELRIVTPEMAVEEANEFVLA